MKWVFIFCVLISLSAAATDSTKLYQPYANVEKDIAEVVTLAQKEKKHILLQIGGNWCVPCYRLHATLQTDSALKALLNNNYLVYHLNYSKENKNLTYLKKLGFPQRFGFPVLVVLDRNGLRIHTQDVSLLSKGNGYDTDKLKSFLMSWSPASIDEVFYRE